MKHPTKTQQIEKAWLREIRKRWTAFAKAVAKKLTETQITNANFEMSTQQQKLFMVWLEDAINQLLLDNGDNWQSKYQLSSYQRALVSVRQSLTRQGASLSMTPDEYMAEFLPESFATTPALAATSSMAASTAMTMQPIHQDALEFLFARSYETLSGYTAAMAKETRQILFDGAQQGMGARQVARLIKERVGISKRRAELIARTETIQAYQQGSANEAERASEELDTEILMEWSSAEDSRVRPLHDRWNDTRVSIEENRRRIGKSPWNCRCSQLAIMTAFD